MVTAAGLAPVDGVNGSRWLVRSGKELLRGRSVASKLMRCSATARGLLFTAKTSPELAWRWRNAMILNPTGYLQKKNRGKGQEGAPGHGREGKGVLGLGHLPLSPETSSNGGRLGELR